MNYLTHLYLAEDTPESIVGNLLGDFVKGSAINDYSEGIKAGIKLHRKIDIFTDSHIFFKKSKYLINDNQKRYAGIIVDIFYDHYLAKKWSDYSAVSLNNFAVKVYQILEDYRNLLPESLIKILPNMISNNLLVSYSEISGINAALSRLSLKLKRKNNLAEATQDLENSYQCFESNFGEFFPELVQYVQSLKTSSKNTFHS